MHTKATFSSSDKRHLAGYLLKHLLKCGRLKTHCGPHTCVNAAQQTHCTQTTEGLLCRLNPKSHSTTFQTFSKPGIPVWWPTTNTVRAKSPHWIITRRVSPSRMKCSLYNNSKTPTPHYNRSSSMLTTLEIGWHLLTERKRRKRSVCRWQHLLRPHWPFIQCSVLLETEKHLDSLPGTPPK